MLRNPSDIFTELCGHLGQVRIYLPLFVLALGLLWLPEGASNLAIWGSIPYLEHLVGGGVVRA